MPRLRTTGGRRAPRREPSPSPPRGDGRGVGDVSIDGVVDIDISDVESSESEQAGGHSDIVDIPIDDVESDDAEMRAEVAARAGGYSVIDIPIDDIESASDAADKPGTRKARRATQPISPIHGKHGNSGEAGLAVANVPVEDVCTRRARRATQPIRPIHGKHGNSGEAGLAVANGLVEDVGAYPPAKTDTSSGDSEPSKGTTGTATAQSCQREVIRGRSYPGQRTESVPPGQLYDERGNPHRQSRGKYPRLQLDPEVWGSLTDRTPDTTWIDCVRARRGLQPEDEDE